MNKFCLCVLLAVFALAADQTEAQMKHALGALAVSPDNKTLVAAGYNRVMYVCDPSDMSVQKRIYLKIIPSEIYYSTDGKSVVMFSSDRLTTIYDAETWKRKAEIKSTQDISIAPDSNEMVILHGTTYSDGTRFSPIAVYDMTTGEKKREARFEFEAAVIGANSDASQIVMMTRSRNDKSEEKKQTPKELAGVEKIEFEQKHDGRISDVMWIDGKLKETNRYTTYYSESGTNQLVVNDNLARYVVYRNRCAEMTPDGEVKLFETGTNYNYGIGVSNDKQLVAAGGMSTGMIMKLGNKTSINFDHSRLPGFPEYFYGFAFGPDGTIYGGTSAWRIIKISPDGEVLSETPIY